jgi:hypothetical protein
MDLLSFSMISFCICSSINTSHPSCISFNFRVCASSVVFSASSGALHCVNFICFQSLRKSVVLILLHLLRRVQPLLKVFWSSLQTSFLDKWFLHTVSLLPSEFPTVVPSFPIAPKFSISHQVSHCFLLPRPVPHCAEFSRCALLPRPVPCCAEFFRRALLSRQVFHCAGIFRHNSLLRQVSRCFLLLRQFSPLRQNFRARFTTVPEISMVDFVCRAINFCD